MPCCMAKGQKQENMANGDFVVFSYSELSPHKAKNDSLRQNRTSFRCHSCFSPRQTKTRKSKRYIVWLDEKQKTVVFVFSICCLFKTSYVELLLTASKTRKYDIAQIYHYRTLLCKTSRPYCTELAVNQ